MKRSKPRTGFTITELLVVVLIVSICVSLVVPALAKVKGDSMVQESMSNLMTLSVAHVMYAADFNGRQVTFAIDDLSVYGSVSGYNDAHDCSPADFWGPECIPPVIAGWGLNPSSNQVGLYAYWPSFPGHSWAVDPIGFPESTGIDGFGNFRLGNSKRIHDYVGGRYYDPTFYAPNDTVAFNEIEPAFDNPFEFDTAFNVPSPVWTSYAMSPAAMYHHDVMRSNAAGGWQNPWSIDHGFESPGLFQATYPDLKTHIIEHNWLQNSPADCNPNDPCANLGDDCTPYQFNHGIDSSPASLFYDGHIRLLPNTEVLAADQQVLKDTGGVDGLWHRGTSFGENGYCISSGFDGVPLSHHILTTDGIMGRDTLSDVNPLAGESRYFNSAAWRKAKATASNDKGLDTNDGDKPDKPIWSFELVQDIP